eukprot:PhM_4_TR10860/c0_g1_i1/m.70947/K03348/APC1; anaphase-promoting complex subunit 1
MGFEVNVEHICTSTTSSAPRDPREVRFVGAPVTGRGANDRVLHDSETDDILTLGDDKCTVIWSSRGQHVMTVTRHQVSHAVVLRTVAAGRALVVAHRDEPDPWGRCGPNGEAHNLTIYTCDGNRLCCPIVNLRPQQLICVGGALLGDSEKGSTVGQQNWLMLGAATRSHHAYATSHIPQPRDAVVADDALYGEASIRTCRVIVAPHPPQLDRFRVANAVTSLGASVLSIKSLRTAEGDPVEYSVVEVATAAMVEKQKKMLRLVRLESVLDWGTVRWREVSGAELSVPSNASVDANFFLLDARAHSFVVYVAGGAEDKGTMTSYRAIDTFACKGRGAGSDAAWMPTRSFGNVMSFATVPHTSPIMLYLEAAVDKAAPLLHLLDARTNTTLASTALAHDVIDGTGLRFNKPTVSLDGRFSVVSATRLSQHRLRVGIQCPFLAGALGILNNAVPHDVFVALEAPVLFGSAADVASQWERFEAMLVGVKEDAVVDDMANPLLCDPALRMFMPPSLRVKEKKASSSACAVSLTPLDTVAVVSSLHLYREALRILDAAERPIRSLGRIVRCLSAHLGLTNFTSYYDLVDGGNTADATPPPEFGVDPASVALRVGSSMAVYFTPQAIATCQLPPNVFGWIEGVLARGTAPFPWPITHVAEPNMKRLQQLTGLFTEAFTSTRPTPLGHAVAWYHRLVEGLYVIRWDKNSLRPLVLALRTVFAEALAVCKEQPVDGWDHDLYTLIGRPDVAFGTSAGHTAGGLVPHKVNASTQRALTALSSSIPHKLKNFDPTTDAQALLREKAKKVLAVGVGRGMATLHQQTKKDGPVTVPDMVFTATAGKVVVKLHDPSEFQDEKILWGEFHNACAAGLEFASSATLRVSRDWVHYRVGSVQGSVARAGVLLAFGLSGHLRTLTPSDVYTLLSFRQRHDSTIMALLLGTCTASRGSADSTLNKCLTMHIQALVPPTLDIDLHQDVQASALLSLGLLHEGSAHRFYTEVLLGELTKPPNDEYCTAREGYALQAGFGLGFLLLGRGRQHNLGFSVEDFLVAAIQGASREALRTTDGCVQRAFDGMDLDGSRLSSRLRRPTTTQMKPSCTRVLETEQINVRVAGPGATVALALQYIMSNDALIAAHLAVPTTASLLEYLNADQAIVRVVCYWIVMWDDVEATKSWLRQNLPAAIADVMRAPENEEEAYERAVLDARPGGVRHLQNIGASVNAGAVLALGLRFLGTHRHDIRDIVLAELSGYLAGNVGTYNVSARQSNLSPMESCVAACAVAAGLVMCGSTDEATSTVIRTAQTTAVSYGLHMALGTALGLVHLGGGTLTFDKTPATIATLLCSLYPLWPMSVTDNQLHLQATRHLYAACTVRRTLYARDSASNDPISVPIVVFLEPDPRDDVVPPPLHLHTPCLLPPYDDIQKIAVLGESRGCYTNTIAREVLCQWAAEQRAECDRIITVVRTTAYERGGSADPSHPLTDSVLRLATDVVARNDVYAMESLQLLSVLYQHHINGGAAASAPSGCGAGAGRGGATGVLGPLCAADFFASVMAPVEAHVRKLLLDGAFEHRLVVVACRLLPPAQKLLEEVLAVLEQQHDDDDDDAQNTKKKLVLSTIKKLDKKVGALDPRIIRAIIEKC